MRYYSFGKVSYTTILSKKPKYSWSYSCNELEEELNALLIQKKLKSVYVGLDGYLHYVEREENYFDFTDMSGTVLMIFSDDIALELDIEAEGLVAYRVHKVSDLTFDTTVDFPPYDSDFSGIYFHDMKDEFALSYELTNIKAIKVDGTSTFAFSARGLDEERAVLSAEQNILPTNIHFILDNNVKISLIGDSIEYFYMYLEQI